MRLLPALVVVSCMAVPDWLPSATAQLVRMSADGSFEHILNEDRAPNFLPSVVDVAFTFELRDAADVSPLIDTGTKVYEATAALLTFGDFSLPLQNAMFEVSHGSEEALEWTSYLLTGETADGWRFFLQNVFPTPAEGSALFPIVSPGDLIVHAVTLSDDAADWAAFGDGVIRSIVVQPVPEPATFALSGAMLAGGLIIVRAARRRVNEAVK